VTPVDTVDADKKVFTVHWVIKAGSVFQVSMVQTLPTVNTVAQVFPKTWELPSPDTPKWLPNQVVQLELSSYGLVTLCCTPSETTTITLKI
jgi:hypothetical protein